MKLSTIAIGVGLLALVFFATGGTSDADVNAAVALALQKETDPSVLRAFAQKLRDAGRYNQADAIDARATLLEGQAQMQQAKTIQVAQPGGLILALPH